MPCAAGVGCRSPASAPTEGQTQTGLSSCDLNHSQVAMSWSMSPVRSTAATRSPGSIASDVVELDTPAQAVPFAPASSAALHVGLSAGETDPLLLDEWQAVSEGLRGAVKHRGPGCGAGQPAAHRQRPHRAASSSRSSSPVRRPELPLPAALADLAGCPAAARAGTRRPARTRLPPAPATHPKRSSRSKIAQTTSSTNQVNKTRCSTSVGWPRKDSAPSRWPK